jgi:hypothetical protein
MLAHIMTEPADLPGESRGALDRLRSRLHELRLAAGNPSSRSIAIRSSDSWLRYIHAVDALLAEPWLLSHPERGLPHVYGRYAILIEEIGGHPRTGRRRRD